VYTLPNSLRVHVRRTLLPIPPIIASSFLIFPRSKILSSSQRARLAALSDKAARVKYQRRSTTKQRAKGKTQVGDPDIPRRVGTAREWRVTPNIGRKPKLITTPILLEMPFHVAPSL